MRGRQGWQRNRSRPRRAELGNQVVSCVNSWLTQKTFSTPFLWPLPFRSCTGKIKNVEQKEPEMSTFKKCRMKSISASLVKRYHVTQFWLVSPKQRAAGRALGKCLPSRWKGSFDIAELLKPLLLAFSLCEKNNPVFLLSVTCSKMHS